MADLRRELREHKAEAATAAAAAAAEIVELKDHISRAAACFIRSAEASEAAAAKLREAAVVLVAGPD